MELNKMKNATQVYGITHEELINDFRKVLKEELELISNNFQPKEPNEWITRKYTSELLSVSLVTISDWSNKGILNPYRIGNRVMYKRFEVEQALTPINKAI